MFYLGHKSDSSVRVCLLLVYLLSLFLLDRFPWLSFTIYKKCLQFRVILMQITHSCCSFGTHENLTTGIFLFDSLKLQKPFHAGEDNPTHTQHHFLHFFHNDLSQGIDFSLYVSGPESS